MKKQIKWKNNLISEKTLLIIAIAFILFSSFACAEIIWGSQTKTVFDITDTSPVCQDGEFWVTFSGDGGKTETPSLNDCYREDGWPSTTCCPSETSCVLDTEDDDYNNCVGPPAPRYCSNYSSQEECEGFNTIVANRSVQEKVDKIRANQGKQQIPNFCGYVESEYISEEEGVCERIVYNCSCVWNEDSESDYKCESHWSYTDWYCDDSEDFNTAGHCQYSTINADDDCENSGYITYRWTAKWILNDGEDYEGTIGDGTWPDYCASGSTTIPCIGIVKLSFFTTATIIIAAIIFVIIYWFIVSRKKKYRKKSNKRKKKK